MKGRGSTEVSQYSLYLVSCDVLYFPQPNKRRIYATPLRSIYLVWLHNKYKYNVHFKDIFNLLIFALPDVCRNKHIKKKFVTKEQL